MKTNKKEVIRKILFVCFVLIFLYSLFNIFIYFKEIHDLREKYDFVQEMIQINSHENLNDIQIQNPQENLPTIDKTSEDISDLKDFYEDLKINIAVDWDTLSQKASELVGWIYIPDTNINYPIVQNKSSNQYYVRRDYEGNWTIGGSIFLNKDTDIDSKHVIVYGHNMQTDIMFHRLRNYKDQEYVNSHPYIYIVTEEETKIYQIFSVVYAPYYSNAYTYDFENPNNLSFLEYIEQETNNSMIKTTTRTIVENDKILTLSTCSGRAETERMLVHAVLVATY